MEQERVKSFDLQRMLLPEGVDFTFLLEVAFRTFFMFGILLIFLKLSGKRSIAQLSLFEIALIVGLGSAAGDPMFYYEVGLLPILVVFIVVGLSYKALTNLTLKSDKAEKLIEGKVDPLLRNDIMVIENLDSQALSYEEFFGFLRILHVEHLGQVRAAYHEINGDISVFFYPDDQIKPGLPISPEALRFSYSTIETEGLHSCTKCGFTVNFKAGVNPICHICKNDRWVRSSFDIRIA